MKPEQRLDAMLRLALKENPTRAEEAKYDRLRAEHDSYLRATGATHTAFEAMLGRINAPETPKANDLT